MLVAVPGLTLPPRGRACLPCSALPPPTSCHAAAHPGTRGALHAAPPTALVSWVCVFLFPLFPRRLGLPALTDARGSLSPNTQPKPTEPARGHCRKPGHLAFESERPTASGDEAAHRAHLQGKAGRAAKCIWPNHGLATPPRPT